MASVEQINDLIAGYTDLKAYFEGVRDQIDDKLSDLAGLVIQMGAFAATWDPDEPNPTNVNGGVFSNLDTLLNSAPRGSTIYVDVAAGAVIDFPYQRSYIISRYVRFTSDPANPAVLNFPCYINENGNNAHNRFHMLNDGEIAFKDINLTLAGKSDPAKQWQSSQSAIIAASHGDKVRCRLDGCHVVGADDAYLLTNTTGILTEASLTNVEFSGAMRFLHNANDGVAVISTDAITLSGGAVLQTGGTLVTGDVLTN